MDHSADVLGWIEENFIMCEIEIESCPLFPYGRLITDTNGETMIVYWDIVSGQVDYRFP
ncbi:hypothetical protein [Geomicrobium sediminis]|uniref:Uncharacterized protein n=1 Tax=Geomicrobium sediminis TaxID=1347788 RepID=A0ABS2PG68_9BACL|nr:hypothetical protein [Geomicrobium sediminis]MBM7634432.1 hypothetical protein [Geomicrobium sediminis]